MMKTNSNNQRIKIMTVVGTRPEIIRLSRIIPLLDEYTDHKIAHTGQNYDNELNEIFFESLKIRKPDYFFNINTTSLGTAIGDVMIKTEEVLKIEKPDALLILGDTNSSLSAYIAKRMHIPIFHMEAGNRSFDLNVPEEINRKVIDHISDFNLVYTEHARRHLISEGISHRRIYLTGSPMFEVLKHYESDIEKSIVLKELDLTSEKYFMVSFHREENVDNQKDLQTIIMILNKLSIEYNIPVIVSTHPRTRKRLDQQPNIKIEKNIKFLKPFGFIDYIQLQKNAYCVISDSGTVSEEAAMLSFPAISLRNSMERPEAQDAGSIILTGLDEDVVLNSVRISVERFGKSGFVKIPEEYCVENCSDRVLRLIQGLSKLSNRWSGVRDL